MVHFALILQLAAAAHKPVAPADSIALLARVEEREFRFIMDWRYQIEWDSLYEKYAGRNAPPRHIAVTPAAQKPPAGAGVAVQMGRGAGSTPASASGPAPRPPSGTCSVDQPANFDADQHSFTAHLIGNPANRKHAVCPVFTRAALPPQPPGWLDQRRSIEGRDTIRAHRRALLRILDSAAAKLPGDHWLVGQRVRFYIDQDEGQSALRVARSCGAEPWWCAALTAYVQFSLDDWPSATRSLVTARDRMPPAVRAAWDDIALFLPFTARAEFTALPASTRDSLSAIAWWLGDPLFLEDGNDRLVEQTLRHVQAELHENEVDVWRDWRPVYEGPPLTEMVLRYGWPGPFTTCRSGMRLLRSTPYKPGDPTSGIVTRGAPMEWPIPFRTGDVRNPAEGLGCMSTAATYHGPQFHTMPSWHGIQDPIHLTTSDWDLAPMRDVGGNWDGSWWAPEFYLRLAGPLVPLEFQAALMRRRATPVLAAAMQWDTVNYTFPPPPRVTAAAITMAAPDAPRIGTRDTMSSAHLRALTATIPTGPSVLSLEMLSRDGRGTAGRARIGIDAPPPLERLRAGEIALSDPVLVRTAEGQSEPRTLAEMLTRMLGTTTLRDTVRVGVFWEVYGLADADTVDVSITVTRKNDAGLFRRLGTLVGVGRAGADSIGAHWREPRRGDAATVIDGGVSIRPRGMVLGLAQLGAGDYVFRVTVARGAVSASSRRAFTIVK